MAASCPKCSATIAAGMRTCQFCGASVDSVEPVAAESLQAESPASESSADKLPTDKLGPDANALATPTIPAEQATSVSRPALSGLKKIVLYYMLPPIGAILVLIVVLRVVSMSSFKGSGTSADTSPGASSADLSDSATAEGLGVDVYPGARAAADADRSTSADSTVVSQTFTTSDPIKGVIEYYKTKMVGYASIYADGASVVCSFSPSAKESVRVAISPDASGGTTRIYISHTTNKGSN